VRPVSSGLEVDNILIETNRKFYGFISSEHVENILFVKDALNSLFLSEFPSMSPNMRYALVGTGIFRFSDTRNKHHAGGSLHGIIANSLVYTIGYPCEEKMTLS
jgi:hypothetical protein